MDTFRLCKGNYGKVISFRVYDWDPKFDNKLIGFYEIKALELFKLMNNENKIHTFKLSRKHGNGNYGNIVFNQVITSNYDFKDYLYGNTNISVIFGIDFTGSNGNPTSKSSLHYVFDKHKLSPYQQAIRAVGNVVSNYDSDSQFPVYGFGGQYLQNNRTFSNTSHSFNLNVNDPEYECNGIYGVEQLYLDMIKNSKIQLSGPTYFAPILTTACDIARKLVNTNDYCIFLLITDGAIYDMDKTKKVIKQASNEPLPLSIIIIGVGNADFSKMEELDGDDTHDGSLGNRDIVQFVSMKDYISNNNTFNTKRLASDTLKEIPNQLIGYMAAKGKVPQIQNYNHSDIQNFNDIYEVKNDNNIQPSAPPLTASTEDINAPLPSGWQRGYNMNGSVYYIDPNGNVCNEGINNGDA